jgi:hypothetical protein
MDASEKIWGLTRKKNVKVTLFMKTRNDPTVITDTLPQTASPKTIISVEVEVLTKVLNSMVSKVQASLIEQYSTVWRSFCGNFNDNSIWTGLEWSQRPRKSKLSGKSSISNKFHLFGRSPPRAAASK